MFLFDSPMPRHSLDWHVLKFDRYFLLRNIQTGTEICTVPILCDSTSLIRAGGWRERFKDQVEMVLARSVWPGQAGRKKTVVGLNGEQGSLNFEEGAKRIGLPPHVVPTPPFQAP